LHNYGDLERTFGQLAPEPLPAKPRATAGFDVDDFIRRHLHEIWNRRMFNVIRHVYAENYEFHGSSGRELYGRGDYTAFVLSLLAAFPDARFSIDQLYWQGDEQSGYRTSMRWSLVGTHEGFGLYGDPTGVRLRVWGLTQHVIKDGKFVEEWTLFNEFSVLKRLYLARAANGS
jgi:predicted ester cyclase